MELNLNITEKEIISITNDMDLGRLIRKRFWNLKEENEYLNNVGYVSTLYSGIENLIINWEIDGTETAGHLTRQIMQLIEKQK
jgi:hypothetical protein